MCDIIIRKWDPVPDRVVAGRFVCRRCKEQFFYRMMLQIVNKRGQGEPGPEYRVIEKLRAEICLSPGMEEGGTDGI